MKELGKANFLLVALGLTLLICSRPPAARAIPVFAHRYGVSCRTCHTIVPELNRFGESFREAGYRWPAAVSTHAPFPVATKVNLAYTSAQDASGLPRAIVDEVEFLSFGPVRNHLTYRIEQYWIDGGRIGKTRDAFLEYQSDPMRSWQTTRAPELDLQIGQFTLPLPDDPETMRPTENHYAVFDQTVGENPFDLFDDGLGINAGFGSRYAGVNALALNGHDPQSGLPAIGLDTMFSAHIGPPAFSLWGYLYDGSRPLGVVDRFARRGVALTSSAGKSRVSLLLQTGNDSNAFGEGPAASSGGYLQEEWTFSDRWIGVIRYDGADSPNEFLRSTTISLSYRPYDRARWTVEDVYQRTPQTLNTLNAAWLFAF